ncbi:carbohydrate porin [Bradyrhizobium sp.]|uniref:carbohydrate porin n=3 Tax=Nitrobacteraceae TaxID=41294 RepID=UPI0003A9B3B8
MNRACVLFAPRVAVEQCFPIFWRSVLPGIMTNETREMAVAADKRGAGGRRRIRLVVGIGLGAMFSFEHVALAADLAVSASVPYTSTTYDWTGWYIGAHAGALRGSTTWTSTPLGPGGLPLNGAFDLPLNFNFMAGTGSYVLGLQGGYNYVLPSRVMLGIEGDVSVPNSDVVVPYSVKGNQSAASSSIGQVTYGESVIHYGSIRGRVGYAFDHFLLYGTGGFAWTYDQVTRSQDASPPAGSLAPAGTLESKLLWRLGWVAGVGVEIPITGNWSAKAEFLETGFGRKGTFFPASADGFQSDLAMQSVRVGLNYKIGDTNPIPALITRTPEALETDRFAFHAQSTLLEQYASPFRSPYVGTNSLNPNQARETFDATFYAGMKLWDGAEAWVNPEMDQGFGLSSSVGAAGFPSGEAYKVGANYPYVRLHRAFLRQTIDLGGDAQKIDSGFNQFAGSTTSDRLVITLGKIGIPDIFDTNKYAHDPRSDFMNWSIVDTGTFDYAADAWGYALGGAIEWYTGPWTFRGGIFDLSVAPNTTSLDSRFGQFQWIGEIERRYSILGQPGKIAVTGFLTRGGMGSFNDAIQLAAVTGAPADITAVRRYQSRGGISMNLEQQINENVGFFARAGWADGHKEAYEFTDIDRSVAAGFSMSGRLWGRNDDIWAIAGVDNGITKVHQAFLNAGGLGILVGDGQLPHPGDERILETYYSFPWFASRITLDYQLIVNPAYNRDRGPASVLGVRLHTQY